MNIIILGGFLGSGKTTLLRSLAEFLVKRPQKADEAVVAIIENEIGDVSIDDLTLSRGAIASPHCSPAASAAPSPEN